MKKTTRHPVRAATTAAVIGAVLVLGLPIGWPHLGAAQGRWIWNDLPGRPAAAGPPAPGSPGGGSHPRTDPGQKLLPGVIPPRGTVIGPRQPVQAVAPQGNCHFLSAPGGHPARWDPATPIPFVVRRPAGPPNGLEMVQEALQRISDASGYRFVFRGLTDELPSFGSHAALTGRMWIGWAFDDEVPQLKGADTFDTHTLGVGGPQVEFSGGSARIDGANVALRADQDLADKFGPGQTLGNVLIHEILHGLNLDHTTDPHSVMYPSLSAQTRDGLGPVEIHELQALFKGTPC